MKLTIIETFTYYSLKLISLFICQFPRKILIYFGTVIGDIIRIIIPIRKKVALQNLKIAFPDLSKNEINVIVKKCYRHFGIIFFDLFRIPNLQIKNIDKFVKFDDADIQKFKSKNGGIIVSGHIGNWEMFLPLFSLKSIPLSAIAQFQRNKGAQKFFNELREFHGSKIILKGSSSKSLLNELKKNNFLGLASDQNAGKRGMMVPFFGRDTSVPKGVAVFHLKSKAPIISCYCVADLDYNYKIIVSEIESSILFSENKIEDICKLISLDLEKIVKKYPEQYFWFHRKWPKKIYKTK